MIFLIIINRGDKITYIKRFLNVFNLNNNCSTFVNGDISKKSIIDNNSFMIKVKKQALNQCLFFHLTFIGNYCLVGLVLIEGLLVLRSN